MIIEPVVLYENSQGTNSNITLKDNVSNYKYLEFIGYGNIFKQSVYTRYDVSTGNDISVYAISTNTEQIRVSVISYKISGKNLTKDKNVGFLFISTANANTNHQDDLRITKVLGYK